MAKTSERNQQAAQAFIESLPYAKALGLELTEIGRGTAHIDLPYDTRLIGDPQSGVIHGGAVSALMDTCCGAAVLVHPAHSQNTATIDLRIDYMRSAVPGQTIHARAECYHVTRNVAFVRATTFDDDENNPIATATASFTFEALHKEHTQ